MNWKAEGFVLAGGASRRMGKPKALCVFQGETLLVRAVRTLRQLEIPVRALLGPGQQFDTGTTPVLRDMVPEAGPLGGLLTALTSTRSDWNLLLACDLPLVSPELFEILGRFRRGHDIVAPCDASGRIHPLCALYRRTCLAEVAKRVEGGSYQVEGLLRSRGIRLRVVGSEEHELPDWRFENVNTEHDLARCERRSDQRESGC